MNPAAQLAVTDDLLERHGLTRDEYRRIVQLLGRDPNLVEIGVFSAMWSEHCSYKSSKPFLKTLPTQGPRVIQGPGENAGVVDIGEGLAAVFKIESHNHPSFIEPCQGAATGVGGILRDIFTMGARPIALLDSLRFGEPDHPRTRYLFNGVVSGIAGYGNCVGVPTVGGDIYFDACYNGNILVNVFCLGLARADRIFLGRASGAGNAVIYAGSKTGRDGIHGASMASAEFDDSTEEKRPTVQVGDPFTEKLLLEACLEIMKQDWIVGVQDMGAAGLTSSSFEMADRAGMGLQLNLDQVPLRETGMNAYEIMLSESQERMLFVIRAGHEQEALDLFRKWDLDAAVIGRVVEGDSVMIRHHGQWVVDLPVAAVVHGALEVHRPTRRPAYLDEVDSLDLTALEVPDDFGAVLRDLLAGPGLASRRWVWEQYDHMVRLNTQVLPGSDAAVLRVPGTGRALALSVDCNSRYCYLDPFTGGQIAAAEACRNVVCSGAEPIGVTNCLNFGNPENPEILWQLEQAVRGLGDWCRFYDIPVVSGNVSLYNETRGEGIFPTPTVAVVGLLEDAARRCTQGFKRPGDRIALLGFCMEELGGSEYLKQRTGRVYGRPPALDQALEKQVQHLCLRWIREGLLASAHDCAEGGLAVAVAECCLTAPAGPLGAELTQHSALRPDALLFGETQSRIVISFAPEQEARLKSAAEAGGVPFEILGTVQDGPLRWRLNETLILEEPLPELNRLWSESLENKVSRVG